MFHSTGIPTGFFSRTQPINEMEAILEEVDLHRFISASKAWVKTKLTAFYTQWDLFTNHLLQKDMDTSEKLILLKVAFRASKNPIEPGELAQFLTLGMHVKIAHGTRLFRSLFTENAAVAENSIRNYLTVCQLLLDLEGETGLRQLIEKALPSMSALIDALREKHAAYLLTQYPPRNLDEVIARFGEKDELVQFPLSTEELQHIKTEYCSIENYLPSLKTLTQTELQVQSRTPASREQLIAIIVETVRRVFKMLPHDTQRLAFLALLNSGEGLKGRIGQIKTGEGKSLIIAMLSAYMACQGEPVDVVTSSTYLAKFACETNREFFQALGLTTSHICHKIQTTEHFSSNIIYGTNTDYEFAMLRDGLYQRGVRDRDYGVVIVDEADNFFIDLARSSARIAIPGDENIAWVYEPILDYAKTLPYPTKLWRTEPLRSSLLKKMGNSYKNDICAFSDRRLSQWFTSAMEAWHVKKENKDYLVKRIETDQVEAHDEIVIIDFQNTGRLNEGCQWQHGMHQFLQVKHHLPVTPDLMSIAAIDHHNYFSLYSRIIGLTGTMGELAEREEIKTLYQLDSFDVPPHISSKRSTLAPQVVDDKQTQYEAILGSIKAMQEKERPTLILFETIETSNEFKHYLIEHGLKPQLLNATQRESEDYIIGRAGEAGMITIATNMAGRGTDIKLSPKSKKAGGLHMIFSFYPKNQRVEDQGKGRAGRQKDKGSCTMILNCKEAYPSEFGRKQLLEIKAFLNYIDDVETTGAPRYSLSEYKIRALNRERTERIMTQSKERALAAQTGSFVFEKQQRFFGQLKALHLIFKEDAFKKQVIQFCSTGSEQSPNTPTYDLSRWEPVKKSALALLQKQEEGLTIDWSYFYDQFKQAYLNQVNKIWAKSYSQLQDDLREEGITDIKAAIDVAYEKVQTELFIYLSSPRENTLSCLSALFNAVRLDYSECFVSKLGFKM
jgi:preprotein translocase subunit SecA